MATLSPSEQEVIAALIDALDPVPVWWGYAPQESADLPPSLPMVVVMRTSAIVRTDWDDMCDLPPGDPLAANITLQIRIWNAQDYAAARDLMADARAAVRELGGWNEQSEFDTRDGELRAWLIISDWLAEAAPLE
jgi:hypothetical protein